MYKVMIQVNKGDRLLAATSDDYNRAKSIARSIANTRTEVWILDEAFELVFKAAQRFYGLKKESNERRKEKLSC